MTSTPPTVLLAAKPPVAPAAPEKPKPSRTPYRPASDTRFGEALRAATAEAAIAQSMLAPSAARIAAPPAMNLPAADDETQLLSALAPAGLPGTAPTGLAAPLLAPRPGVADARLWESLMRPTPLGAPPAPLEEAPPFEGGPEPVTALAARAQPLDPPAARAVTPAALREQGQAFLRSIRGFDQTSVGEYESVAQARAWGYSTCSAASLTAVLRAAGQDVRIADVMKAMPGGITIKLGLVSRPSLVNAARQFGAEAADDVSGYEALRQATENGQPVLVDIRNGRFPEGHWIVVTGVDEQGVRVADSSRYDLTTIPRGEFLRSWSGKGIRISGLGSAAAPARANVQSA